MDPTRLIHASNEIDRLNKALEWLRAYGGNLSHAAKDTFSIQVNLNYASALPGAKEAEKQLSAIARLQIEEIVAMAVNDAVNTIDCHVDNIRKEVAPTIGE